MNEIVFKSVVWKKEDESFWKMPSRDWVKDWTQVLSHRRRVCYRCSTPQPKKRNKETKKQKNKKYQMKLDNYNSIISDSLKKSARSNVTKIETSSAISQQFDLDNVHLDNATGKVFLNLILGTSLQLKTLIFWSATGFRRRAD